MAQTKNSDKIVKKEKTATVKAATKKAVDSHLVVDVYDTTGKVVGSETLNKEIFDKLASEALMAQAVRVFSFNKRSGTVSVKDRSEVRGGGRKPWRQKGTGRARQGSIRSPQWRGGGVIHGPEPKDWSLDLNKKQRRAALLGALSLKARDKQIVLLQELELKEPKTKQIFTILEKLPGVTGKKTLVVLDNKDDTIYRSVKNLPKAAVNTVANLNTLEIIAAQKLLLTKKSIASMNTFLVSKEKN